MALLMITGAEQLVEAVKNNVGEVMMPYLHPVSITPCFRDRYARERMVERYAEFKKRKKRDNCAEHSVEALIDEYFLPNKEEEFKGFFKRIAKGWLEHKDFGGSKIPNFLVDYVNLGVLEAGCGLPLAYITEDGPFKDMVRDSDDAGFAESKKYYEKFWRG